MERRVGFIPSVVHHNISTNEWYFRIRPKSKRLARRYKPIWSANANATVIQFHHESQEHDSHHHHDCTFMKVALRLARKAYREYEVPVGAVLVCPHGTIVSTGHNQVEQLLDATSHAEMNCVRNATRERWTQCPKCKEELQKSNKAASWRLLDCTLYSTVEPCVMCYSALQLARVKTVIYGAKDIRLGADGSFIHLGQVRHPFHKMQVIGGIMDEQCAALMKSFFKMRRLTLQKVEDGETKDLGSSSLQVKQPEQLVQGMQGIMEREICMLWPDL